MGSYIQGTTQLDLYGDASSSNGLRLDSSGRLGIGSTAPGSRLEVGGESAPRIGINSTGTSTAGVLFQGAGTTYGSIIQNISTGELAIKAGASGQNSYFITFGTNDGSEKARLDVSGRLLVGTSSARLISSAFLGGGGANAELEVEGTALAMGSFASNRNDSFGPYLALVKSRGTTAGSFTLVSNGDGIGALSFNGTDGSAALVGAAISAFVDGTPGANDMPGRLVFSTTADGSASPTERMRITNAGNCFLGSQTSISSERLGITFAASAQGIAINVASGASETQVIFANPNGTVGTITTSGSVTAYNTSSDYRLKENVTPVTDGISRCKQLKPSRFNFIANPDHTVDGFLAHEAQAVVPDCVVGTKDEVDADGKPKYQGIDQSKLVPLLTAALQEAIAKIEALETRLTAAGIE
jgi:hypothetical protein